MSFFIKSIYSSIWIFIYYTYAYLYTYKSGCVQKSQESLQLRGWPCICISNRLHCTKLPASRKLVVSCHWNQTGTGSSNMPRRFRSPWPPGYEMSALSSTISAIEWYTPTHERLQSYGQMQLETSWRDTWNQWPLHAVLYASSCCCKCKVSRALAKHGSHGCQLSLYQLQLRSTQRVCSASAPAPRPRATCSKSPWPSGPQRKENRQWLSIAGSKRYPRGWGCYNQNVMRSCVLRRRTQHESLGEMNGLVSALSWSDRFTLRFGTHWHEKQTSIYREI